MARAKKSEEVLKEPSLHATKNAKKGFVFAVGRRREAVARIRLYTNPNDIKVGEESLQAGDVYVNNQPAEKYFGGEVAKVIYLEPLRATNTLNKFAVTVRVIGGGKKGQLDAMVHGVSRALAAFDVEKFRPILKKRGFLTRDPRTRQRRKVGMGGKSRRKKQSPKR